MNKPKENILTEKEILEIIYPEIKSYCEELDSKATSSHCPTCRNFKNLEMNYLLVENISQPLKQHKNQYTRENFGERSLMEIRIALIYGFNTRTGSTSLSFLLDEKGNILNKNLSEENCL